MQIQILLLVLVLLTGMVLSVMGRKLTIPGAFTGGLIGLILFFGTGWPGIVFMTLFFVSGILVTGFKRKKKELIGAAEANKGRRRATQVLANSGVAAMAALTSWIFPQFRNECSFLVAVCFSSATADTFSSELGTVYGKRFINILTGKKDQPGLDGVISREGILAGIVGSCLIALAYAGFWGWDITILWIVLAGTLGNLTDSFLGAAWERRYLMGNDMVNFLSTVVAAIGGGIVLFLSEWGINW